MQIYTSPIITEEFLKKYKGTNPNFGFNGLGYVVFRRTYSRLKKDETYEDWYETVARCVNGAQEIGSDYTQKEAERLYDYVFNLKCSFAGRMLWMLGTEHIKRWGGNALINCFGMTITEYEDFCFLFENLMLGGGVGFSVRREDIHELPKVKENIKVTHKNTNDADFIVPDSREGWVYLLRQVLKSYFRSGKSFSYSTILVRGYGEKINGLGGTASGPKILVDGIENICKIISAREGKKLRSIDVLDVCLGKGTKILTNNGYVNIENITNEKIVVPFCSDENIKDSYRFLPGKIINKGIQKTLRIDTLSGNSIITTPNHKFLIKKSHNYIRGKLYQKFSWKRADELVIGDAIVSPNNPSINTKPEFKQDFGVLGWVVGDGYFTKNKRGKLTLGAIFGPGEEKAKRMVSDQFMEWYKTVKIESNNQHTNTFPKISYENNGVGTLPINRQEVLKYLMNKYKLETGTAVFKKIPPSVVMTQNFSIKSSFLSGLFSADGCIQKIGGKKNTWAISLSTVSKEVSEQVYLMLKEFGIHGRISKFHSKGKNTLFQIVIQSKDSLLNFANYIGFSLSEAKNKKTLIMLPEISDKKNRGAEIQKVSRVTDGEEIETYDICLSEGHHFIANGLVVHNCNLIASVVVSGNIRRSATVALGDPDDYLFIRAKRWDLGDIPNWRALSNNTIYVDDFSHIQPDIWEGYLGNGEPYGFFNIKLTQKVGRIRELRKDNAELLNPCAEIPLANKEICCLSELYLNNIKSKEELIDCAKLLYKTQKAICSMKFIHEDTNRIVHKNMRIGIGVTGVCQSLDKIEWLDECYNTIREYDKEWSAKKGYNESIRISTIKPSGTLSLLAGATPGIHPAYSQYYIRRIRMSSDDKLVATCKDLGYIVEAERNFDDTINYKTVIVEFPCYAGENVVLAKDMTAVKQLELVKKLMTIWADNSISVTVYYKKEELPEIKQWLKEHYKDSIKSVSFLLHKEHGFKQAPYEEITKEQYEERISKIKTLKDITVENKHIDFEECKGGACPVK